MLLCNLMREVLSIVEKHDDVREKVLASCDSTMYNELRQLFWPKDETVAGAFVYTAPAGWLVAAIPLRQFRPDGVIECSFSEVFTHALDYIGMIYLDHFNESEINQFRDLKQLSLSQ